MPNAAAAIGDSNDLGSASKKAKVVTIVVENGIIVASGRRAASKAPQCGFLVTGPDVIGTLTVTIDNR
jgi:hypothetical protein